MRVGKGAVRVRVSVREGARPLLQLDGLAVELDRADLEVNADGGDMALGVRVVGEAQQQAGLAHARVADQHKLEDVVVLLRHGANCQVVTARVTVRV